MWKIGWASSNTSRWQMGFNSAFKGSTTLTVTCISKTNRPKSHDAWYFRFFNTESYYRQPAGKLRFTSDIQLISLWAYALSQKVWSFLVLVHTIYILSHIVWQYTRIIACNSCWVWQTTPIYLCHKESLNCVSSAINEMDVYVFIDQRSERYSFYISFNPFVTNGTYLSQLQIVFSSPLE
jgi:hypothetical protein